MQFSQSIVRGRETASRFKCETAGEKGCGNVMAMLNIFFTNVLLWRVVLEQHDSTGSCFGAGYSFHVFIMDDPFIMSPEYGSFMT